MIINLIWKAPLPQNQPQVLKDQKGNLISGIKKQTYEKEELLPENLKKALIKIEDQRYYRHL